MRSSIPSFLSSRLALGTALVAVGLALTLGVVACSDSVAPSSSPDASTATESSPQATADDDDVYMVVENQPELVGGIKALQDAVSYPESAKEAGIEGRVIVRFIVDKNGNVTKPKVTRGVNETLNQAALEAVKQQEFKPGQQDGEPVKVQMSVPVTFRLPDGTPEGEATSSQAEQRNVREKITLEIRPSGKILLNRDIASLDHLTEQIMREVPNPENSILTIKVRSDAPPQLKNEVIRKLRTMDMAKGAPQSRDIQG